MNGYRPEPEAANPQPATVQACSAEDFTIDLNNYFQNLGVAGNVLDDDIEAVGYSWTATSSPLPANFLIGLETTGSANSVTGSTINDNATNPFTIPITVTYVVTPTSVNDCVGDPVSFNVVINPTPQATINPNGDLTLCAGETRTLLGFVVPFGDYTYSWAATNGGTFMPPNSLSPVLTAPATDMGDMVVSFTATSNVTGCSSTVMLTFQVEDNPTASSATLTACESPSGSANGIFTLADANATVIGTQTGVMVTYHTSQNDANLGTAAITTYGGPSTTVYARVTNVAGCFATSVVTLTVDDLPTADAGVDQEVCGETAVTMAGVIGGGASSLTWTHDGDGSFADATLAAAVYTPASTDVGTTVTFTLTTNANGSCPAATDVMTVRFDEQPTADAGPAQEICETTPSITMDGSVGGGVTTGTWTTAGDGTFGNPGVLTTTYSPGANDITSGSVILTLTSAANGTCLAATSTMTLTINPQPTVEVAEIADFCITSAGTTSLSATVSGTPMTYAWTITPSVTITNADMASASIANSDLAAGTYVVTLMYTDDNGCMNSDTETFTVNPLPVAVITPATATICGGESIELTASGGTSFSWVVEGTTDVLGTNEQLTVAPTSTTTYEVTVTDANGCVDTETVTITVAPAPTFAGIIADATEVCDGTTVTYTLTGLLNEETTVTYTIDDGVSTPVTTTLTGTPAGGEALITAVAPAPGTYTVTVESLNIDGCILTLTTGNVSVVEVKPNPTLGGLSAAESTICVGEDLVFTATGLLDGPGLFDYTVTLDGGVIVVAPNVPVTVTGGTLSNNLSNFLAPGEELADVLPGNYVITITRIVRDGCEIIPTGNNTVSYTVVANPVATNAILAVCENNPGSLSGTFDLTDANATVLGAQTAMVTYHATESDAINGVGVISTFTGLSTTVYARVEVSAGCFDVSEVTLTVNPRPTVEIVAVADFCADAAATGNLTFSISQTTGTFDWMLSGPAGTLSSGTDAAPTVAIASLTAGSYTVSVTYTNGNGCMNSDTETFEVFENPVAAIPFFTNPSCAGEADGTATVVFGGGTAVYDIEWSTGSTDSTATGLMGGVQYFVTITDANGCTGEASVMLTDPAAIVVTLTDPADVCLDNGNVTLTGTPTGGVFNGPGVTGNIFTPTIAGVGVHEIIYTLTDANGCTGADTIEIEVFALPEATFALQADICLDEAPITLTGDGVFSGDGVTSTSTATCQEVWINEFHYDNAGSDVGEFIEIAGVEGVNLDGYTVYLYSEGVLYNSNSVIALSGIIIGEGAGFGALNFSLPVNGLQNGPEEAMALVDPSGNVIEFISYEGAVIATEGPANGMTPVDVGVSEPNSTPTGQSLQRIGSGGMGSDFTWTGPTAESPGLLNAGQTVTPCPGTSTYTFDPALATVGTHTITYMVTDANGCMNSSTMDIEVLQTPTGASIALSATEICEGGSANLVFNAGLGDGPFTVEIDSAGTLRTYTGLADGDVIFTTMGDVPVSGGANSSTYTLTSVTAGNGCDVDYSEAVTLTVNEGELVADAGANANVCAGDDYTLVATATGGTILWTTSGDGTFDFTNVEDPIYTPGAADLNAGTVNLTVTVSGTGACAGNSQSDVMILSIIDRPNAGDALTDYEVGNTDPDFCLTIGTLDLRTLLTGSPDANGTFAIVTGNSGAVINGVVLDVSGVVSSAATESFQITYTVSGGSTCPDDVTTLDVVFEVGQFAGSVAGTGYVCSDATTFELFDLLTNFTPGGSWQVITTNVGVSLTGSTFDPSDVLFLPGGTGTTNPISRIVQFRYSVTGSGLCTNNFVDAFVQVNLAPTVEVATTEANNTICYDATAAVTATLGGSAVAGEGMWTTNGLGSFDDPTAESTFYVPDPIEYGTMVRVYYTTNDPDGADNGTFPYNSGICLPAVDSIDIIILDEPEVAASMATEAICSNEVPSITLSSVTLPDGSVVFDVVAVSGKSTTTGFTASQIGLTEVAQLETGMIVNTDSHIDTVTYTITPRDAGPDGTLGTADDCTGDDIVVKVTVDPVPSGSLTVNGGLVDDATNNNGAFIVCDDDGNVTLADFMTFTSPDSTILRVEVTLDNAALNPGTPGAVTTNQLVDLPYNQAVALVSSLTNWRLINPDVAGSVSISLTGYFDRDANGVIGGDEDCDGVTISLNVEINPVPFIADDGGFDVTVCSRVATGVSLPATDDTGLGITSYDVTADVAVGLTGSATTGTGVTDVALIAGDVFTNLTDGSLDVVYTITPYAGNCAGTPFTITVTVDPEPVVVSDQYDVTVCSDEVTGVSLPATDDTGLGITSYDVTADVAVGLTGSAATGSGVTDVALIENDVFTNLTNGSLDVVYTITPYAGDCAGTPFTITVTVSPEPVVASDQYDMTVCSDEATGVSLPATDDAGLALTSYDVTADVDAALTGSASTGTGVTDVALIAGDVFTNLTDGSLDVVYTITPYIGDCVGTPFTITVTVDPEPVVASDQYDVTVCSDDATGVSLPNADDTGLDITSYDVTADVAVGLTGSAATGTGVTDVSLIEADVFTNLTDGSLDVVYTITPYAIGCAGTPFTITVTVSPAPVVVSDQYDVMVCSDEATGVSLPATDDTGLGITSYDVMADVAVGLTGSAATGTAVTDVALIENDVFTNLTDGSLDVVYTITPYAGDCAGTAFTITVTVKPEAVVTSGTFDVTVCSDDEIGVMLPDADDSGLDITSFDVTALVDGDLTGTATTGNGLTDLTSLQDDVFNNRSGAAKEVIYTVTPYVSGCPGTAFTITVTVDPEPVIAATPNIQFVCSDDMFDVTFSETSGIMSTTTYEWLIVGSLPDSVTITSADGMTGTGDIVDMQFNNISSSSKTIGFKAVGTSGGCIGDTVTFSVTVRPEPIAANNSYEICSGTAFMVDLQTLITNNVVAGFSWYTEPVGNAGFFLEGYSNFGSANAGNQPVINDVLLNNSNLDKTIRYIITPTAVDGSCVGETFVLTVTVEARVLASIATLGNSGFCTGETITIEGIGNQGTEPYSYAWSFTTTGTVTGATLNGAATATGKNVDVTAESGSGTIVVSLIITDDNGCSSEVTMATINVTESPASVVVSGEEEVCGGSNSTYSVPAEGGVSYFWQVTSGGTISSSAFGPSVDVDWTASAGGPHLVIVSRTSGTCTTMDTLEVMVIIPDADFTFAPDAADPTGLTYDFTDASSTVTAWNWDFAGLGAGTDQNPSFTFPGSGTYNVCLTIDGPCGMDERCQDVVVTYVSVFACDTVPMVSGINYISFDVDPSNRNVADVFADIIASGRLRSVQGRNSSGGVVSYSPTRPTFLNTLSTIEPGYGYIVSLTEIDTVFICGNSIDPSLRVPLHEGINLVGYIPQLPEAIETYFSTLFPGNLRSVRSYEGGYVSFSPSRPSFLNTLLNVKNGFGYELSMTTAVNGGDWFGENTPTSSGRSVTPEPKASATYILIAASTNLTGEYVGRNVYVTDAYGNRFAEMSVLEGGWLMLTPVYLNDDNAPLSIGTELYLELDGERIAIDHSFPGDKSELFLNVEFTIPSGNETIEVYDYELSLSPNPFKEKLSVNLTLPQSESVSMDILEISGRLISTPVRDFEMPAGQSTIIINGDNLSAGNYILVIRNNDGIIFKERIIRIK